MYTRLMITALMLGLASSVGAADKAGKFEHGQDMHDNHCNKCHSDAVYTRDNRIVKSLDALSKQVKICKNNTGAPWFDEDTEAVVHFLNEEYYKF